MLPSPAPLESPIGCHGITWCSHSIIFQITEMSFIAFRWQKRHKLSNEKTLNEIFLWFFAENRQTASNTFPSENE